MALKNLSIIEKQSGNPLELATATRRLGVPTIIQPKYTFDVSDLYGYFIQCTSIGYGLYWNDGFVDVSIYIPPAGTNVPFIDIIPDQSTLTWDLHEGFYAQTILTNDVSLLILNPSDGMTGSLIVTSTYGNSTIQFPDNTVQINGPIVYGTDPSSVDMVSFLYDGSTYYFWGGVPHSVAAGSTLSSLTDIQFTVKNDGDVLMFDSSTLKWINISAYDIRTYFYTKNEVDALLNAIVGGTY